MLNRNNVLEKFKQHYKKELSSIHHPDHLRRLMSLAWLEVFNQHKNTLTIMVLCREFINEYIEKKAGITYHISFIHGIILQAQTGERIYVDFSAVGSGINMPEAILQTDDYSSCIKFAKNMKEKFESLLYDNLNYGFLVNENNINVMISPRPLPKGFDYQLEIIISNHGHLVTIPIQNNSVENYEKKYNRIEMITSYNNLLYFSNNNNESVSLSVQGNKIKPRICIDIDDTLSVTLEGQTEIDGCVAKYPYLAWFKDNNLLFKTSRTVFFLMPGALELLQYLYSKADVSIFSFGSKQRNNEWFAAVSSRIKCKNTKIFSRKNGWISDEKDLPSELIENCAPLKYLARIYNVETIDENTVLIDNDCTVVMPLEKKNCLITMGASARHFKPDQKLRSRDLQHVNHIFYIAGILNSVLNNKSSSIANSLFTLQYKENGDDNFPYNEYQYYIDGLEVLQRFNPNLDFYHSKEAHELFHTVQNRIARKMS